MFYKEKGFYISLACGIVALVAFATICYSLIGGTGDDGEENPIVAEESPEPVQTAEPETEATSSKGITKEEKKQTEKKATAEPTPTEKTVETATQPVENKLYFDQESGLLWPVEGDVLMEYSADKVVYFKTLAQYRTNPALLISAKEGEQVKASADGVVTDVSTSEETGRTVTVDIGDDFSVSYGQLKDVTVQKGDSVSEGQVLGKVATPTNYYSLEGTNLYFQVKEKEETVNPMLLLR